MIKMMIAFIRDYFRYKEEVKKHDKWIKKFGIPPVKYTIEKLFRYLIFV